MTKQHYLDLMANDFWQTSQNDDFLIQALRNYSFPEETIDALINVKSKLKARDFETLDSLISEKHEDLIPLIKKLKSIRNENATCYLRSSREKSRVIQWPNNPRTKINDPARYFEIFEDLPYRTTHRFINNNTPIGSMGSCFAVRIAHQLQALGYNYIVETPETSDPSGFSSAPARMGTLFNIPSMRQVIEQAFGEWSPPDIAFRVPKKGWIDPFRSTGDAFETEEALKADRAKFDKDIKAAIMKCDVMILTLGLTEAWTLANQQDFLSVAPPEVEPLSLRRVELSVEDNVRELERIVSLYEKHRPNTKIILSVSPVPLNKTFSSINHVVVANTLSKSVLRVAAEQISRKYPDRVIYFPSYEVVTYCTRTPWEPDMRHVSMEAVMRVMKLFQRIFVVDQSPNGFTTNLSYDASHSNIRKSLKSRLKNAMFKLGVYRR